MKYGFISLKMIAISLLSTILNFALCYENKVNKNSLESLERTNLRYTNMKNFAKNLADTKKLRISQS
jgi:hypothetical protein